MTLVIGGRVIPLLRSHPPSPSPSPSPSHSPSHSPSRPATLATEHTISARIQRS